MKQKPNTLDYASPAPRPRHRREPLDPLSGLALAISALSVVTAGVRDRGGMRYHLQVAAGIWGGLVGAVIAVVALVRLARAGRSTSSHAAVAALALTLGPVAVWFGLRLYWR